MSDIEKRLDAIESRLNSVAVTAMDAANAQGVSVSYFDRPLERIKAIEESQAAIAKSIDDKLAAFTRTIEGKQHAIVNASSKSTLGVVGEVVGDKFKKAREEVKADIGGLASELEATRAIASRSTREAEDILLSACNYYGS